MTNIWQQVNKKRLMVLVGVLLGIALAFAVKAVASGHKAHIDRDNTYYTIENDNGDYGNYWETYELPVKYDYSKPIAGTTTGKAFCAVYSDKIGKGGGAAGNCDFEGFYRTHPHAFNLRNEDSP